MHINEGEGYRLEFKSTLRVNIKANGIVDKLIQKMVLKTIAAFLNSEGGTLLIGVDDEKNTLGLELDFGTFNKENGLDEFKKHLDNIIQNPLGNRFQHYLDITFTKIEGKLICAIRVKDKSSEPVYLIEKNGSEIFYIRRQASTINLKPSET